MTEQTEIKYLLKKYISDTHSKREHQRLAALITADHFQPDFESAIEELLSHRSESISQDNKDVIFKKIITEAERRENLQRLSSIKSGQTTIARYVLYAAACLIFIVGSIYLMRIITSNNTNQKLAGKRTPAIKNNSKKPTLTLANGSTIILDDAAKGNVAKYQDVKVLKLDGNSIAYKAQASSPSDSMSFNTLTIPCGQQYQLQLSDGTKVWLNSATSLRFPVTFGAVSRKVELDGEAYFEVAKNPQKKFIVSARNMEVHVLGTHFNVMAYKDEDDIRTTLIEGSVRLQSSKEKVTIKPGEQGVFKNENAHFTIQKANMNVALAWRHGEFNFQNTDIQTIMRQIARWYDIPIEYAGPIPNVELSGIISRKEQVGQLLEILEATNKINFSQHQNRITVSSKINK